MLENVLFGVGIAETYVSELHGSLFGERLLIFGVGYREGSIKHFVYSLCRNLRAGEENEHHQHHQKCHYYLRSEHHKGYYRLVVGFARVDKGRAYPVKGESKYVHNQHHNGAHQRHHPAREQLRLCEV